MLLLLVLLSAQRRRLVLLQLVLLLLRMDLRGEVAAVRLVLLRLSHLARHVRASRRAHPPIDEAAPPKTKARRRLRLLRVRLLRVLRVLRRLRLRLRLRRRVVRRRTYCWDRDASGSDRRRRQCTSSWRWISQPQTATRHNSTHLRLDLRFKRCTVCHLGKVVGGGGPENATVQSLTSLIIFKSYFLTIFKILLARIRYIAIGRTGGYVQGEEEDLHCRR
jgi:hypothetical protein